MTKTIQAKHIPDDLMLNVIADINKKNGGWAFTWDLDEEETLSQFPWKVVRAKCSQLIKRNLLDGCDCGCRGDYELTLKGLIKIGR